MSNWTFDGALPTFDSATFDLDGHSPSGAPAWSGGDPGLSAIPVGPNTAAALWAAATAGDTVTDYRLRITPPVGGLSILDTGGTGLVFNLTGLSPSTTYQLQVAAFDASGNSTGYLPSTPISFTTGATRMTAQYVFGPGTAWITPTINAQGVPLVNQAPILVAGMQDIGIDMSAEMKELYGGNSFAIAVARGKQKMGFKVKNAQVHSALWNAFFFGQTLAPGVYTHYLDNVGVLVPTTPFQITPITAFSANLQGTTPAFGYDLGVRDVNNLPLQRVASGPTTRQYSLSGGVYTFATADVGIRYYFSFNYTATSTVAQSLVIANLPMGFTPYFQFDMIIPYAGNVLSATFPNCSASGVKLATKLDDFAYPEFDVNAFAPGSAAVGTLSWSM